MNELCAVPLLFLKKFDSTARRQEWRFSFSRSHSPFACEEVKKKQRKKNPNRVGSVKSETLLTWKSSFEAKGKLQIKCDKKSKTNRKKRSQWLTLRPCSWNSMPTKLLTKIRLLWGCCHPRRDHPQQPLPQHHHHHQRSHLLRLLHPHQITRPKRGEGAEEEEGEGEEQPRKEIGIGQKEKHQINRLSKRRKKHETIWGLSCPNTFRKPPRPTALQVVRNQTAVIT